MSSENAVREVLTKIEAAWRNKELDGLERCFHEHAVIVGPGYAQYAKGRLACAESYREFAMNAETLAYTEDAHVLRCWEATAVYTFKWRMTYQRTEGPKEEQGTDQLVLQRSPEGWQVVWRYIFFQSAQ